MTNTPTSLNAQPLFITAKNCEAMTGFAWRTLRKHAPALGVPVLGLGRKLVIPAAPLLAALQAQAAKVVEPKAEDLDDAAQLHRMRRDLGLRVVGGGGR